MDQLGTFRRALDLFGDRVAAAPATSFGDPSPCEGWTGGDVVEHVIRILDGLAAGLAGGAFLTTEAVDLGGDVAAAWAAHRAAAETALASASMDQPVSMGRGSFPLGTYLDALTRDVVIHTWDLARAVGGDDRLPDDLVAVADDLMAGVGPSMRRPGSYGPELDAPDGSDRQTRLLARAGRVAAPAP
ncbi:MAG: TIGR03086 family metal-binding protein [Acidimicrobiia bacterium]